MVGGKTDGPEEGPGGAIDSKGQRIDGRPGTFAHETLADRIAEMCHGEQGAEIAQRGQNGCPALDHASSMTILNAAYQEPWVLRTPEFAGLLRSLTAKC